VIVALMFSAVLPSILLLWYFYSRDKYPEPPRVVATAFLLGVATIPVVLGFGRLVELALGDWPRDPYLAGAVDALVYAALPEEALKLAVMVGYVRRHSAFDEPMDGLVYGVATSLGFATLENVLYVSSGNLQLAAIRAATTLPCHCTLGAIMGYYVAWGAFDPLHRRRALALAFVVPTIFHTLYDFPLLAIARFENPGQIPDLVGRGLTGLAFGTLGFMVLWAFGLTRNQRQLQERRHEATRSWARMRRLLFLGGGGLVTSCGGLMVIGGLSEPGVMLVIGGALVLAGAIVFVQTIRRANLERE
jgi:protease PrsW